MRLRSGSRLVFAVILLAPSLGVRSPAQEIQTPVIDPAEDFVADAGAEALRGVYVFYTQNYRDKQNERMALHGSLYGVLRDVQLNGCDVTAKVQVFDLFSGFVDKKPTGQRQDLTEYNIRFRVSAQLASRLQMIRARPAELAHSMHTQCDGEGSCSFNWLQIEGIHGELHEQEVVNHALKYDGPVSQVLAPLSSAEAGKKLIADLQELARTRCR